LREGLGDSVVVSLVIAHGDRGVGCVE
jgi:hypothetical protein